MAMLKWLFTGTLLLSLVACTWVELTPKGEGVRVMSASEVGACERVGKTTVRTTGKLAGMERHADKIQSELDTLARNSAVDIGGDTVVPVNEPKDGVQVYEVYRCLR